MNVSYSNSSHKHAIDISDYADIIDLPHPTSTKHPAMSRDDRAAQFAPYATLSGHRDEVQRDEDWTEEN